jgi:hypothetical protein
MNKVPGDTLYDLQYWTLPEEEHEEITQEFLNVLRYDFLHAVQSLQPDIKLSHRKINELGIQPEDRGLRNVMWDRQRKIWYFHFPHMLQDFVDH